MLRTVKNVLRWVLAGVMVFAGVSHFTNFEFFVAIVPPYLPWHAALVYISGVAEIAGGVGLLVPRTRRAAAWGLIALYVAVFPANIHMAVNNVQPGDTAIDPMMLWLRLPLQAIPIAWAYWFTRPDAPHKPPTS